MLTCYLLFALVFRNTISSFIIEISFFTSTMRINFSRPEIVTNCTWTECTFTCWLRTRRGLVIAFYFFVTFVAFKFSRVAWKIRLACWKKKNNEQICIVLTVVNCFKQKYQSCAYRNFDLSCTIKLFKHLNKLLAYRLVLFYIELKLRIFRLYCSNILVYTHNSVQLVVPLKSCILYVDAKHFHK